jgi:hypothetical protein
MAIYQRGGVFWWKARLRFSFVPWCSVIVRMSLRTASPSQARMRSAALDLVRNATMEQLPILAQISEPGRADDHHIVNLHYARYFTLLAEKPYLLDDRLESFEDLRTMGLSEADADAVSMLAQRHRHQPPILETICGSSEWNRPRAI